jgi:O-antigen ligase
MSGLHKHINFISKYSKESPTVFFISYIFYILIQYPVSAAFVTTFAFYGILLPAFLFFVIYNNNKIIRIIQEPIIKFYLVLFGYIIFHALFLTQGHYGLSKTIGNTIVTAVFLLSTVTFFVYADKNFIHKFFFIFIILVGICAIISLGLYYFYPQTDPRLSPIGRASNQILGALVYGIAGIVSLYIYNISIGIKQKTICITIITIIGAMILLTLSRTPIFAYIFSMGLGVALYSKSLTALFYKVAIFLCALVLLITIIHPLQDILYNYFKPLILRGDSYRFQLWQEAIKGIIEHPLLGNGMQARLTPLVSSPDAYNAHNIYLATFFHIGILGGVFFLYLIGKSLLMATKMALPGEPKIIMVFLLLIFGLISGITDHSQLVKSPSPLWLILWLPIGMVIANNIKKTFNYRS